MYAWLLALSMLLGSWGLVYVAPDSGSGLRDGEVRTMDGGIIPPSQIEGADGGIIPPH
jgi:hypothetical protein